MAPLIIGAAIGAGVSAITGGDIGKGALYGAAGGGIGSAAAGAAGITQATIMGQTVTPSTFGAVAGGIGGSMAGKQLEKRFGPLPSAPVPKKETLATGPPAAASPRPQAIALEAVKERERIKLRKQRGYMSTVLTKGGLGTATTQKQKVLGA